MHRTLVWLEAAGISETFERWFDAAIAWKDSPPKPLAIMGTGAEALGAALAVDLLRCGIDVLHAPVSWVFDGSPLPAEPLPRLTVVSLGLEEPSDARMRWLRDRTPLLLCGDVVPLEHVGGLVVSELAPATLHEIELELAWLAPAAPVDS